MALAAPVLSFFSALSFFIIHGDTHNVLRVNPWILVAAWVGILPLAMIRPLSTWMVSILGAHRPTPTDKDYLSPLWGNALHAVGVPGNRYTLLITERRKLPIDCDFGPYVVTIDRYEVNRLPADELSALLMQRVSRQTIMLSSVLGVCVWASMPLVFWFALSILALRILRVIYRVMFGAAKGAGPPPRNSSFAAGCFLLVIAVGIAAFLAFIIVGAFAVMFLIEAAIAAVIVASLAKWAEKYADSAVVRLGHGPTLVRAIRHLDPAPTSGWRSLVDTSTPPQERVTRIENYLYLARTQGS
jgi:hypothetical protein